MAHYIPNWRDLLRGIAGLDADGNVMSLKGLVLRPETSDSYLEFTTHIEPGGEWGDWGHLFLSMTDVTPYTIQAGDYLHYDVWRVNAASEIGADITFTDATNLRDTVSIVDQDGYRLHPYYNYGDDYGVWHHRMFDLTPMVGKTTAYYDLGCIVYNLTRDDTSRIKNVQITDSTGALRKVIWDNTSVEVPATSVHFASTNSTGSLKWYPKYGFSFIYDRDTGNPILAMQYIDADNYTMYMHVSGEWMPVAVVDLSPYVAYDGSGKVPMTDLYTGVAGGVPVLDGSTKLSMGNLYVNTPSGLASLNTSSQVPFTRMMPRKEYWFYDDFYYANTDFWAKTVNDVVDGMVVADQYWNGAWYFDKNGNRGTGNCYIISPKAFGNKPGDCMYFRVYTYFPSNNSMDLRIGLHDWSTLDGATNSLFLYASAATDANIRFVKRVNSVESYASTSTPADGTGVYAGYINFDSTNANLYLFDYDAQVMEFQASVANLPQDGFRMSVKADIRTIVDENQPLLAIETIAFGGTKYYEW